jgi:hypothetical protein
MRGSDIIPGTLLGCTVGPIALGLITERYAII